ASGERRGGWRCAVRERCRTLRLWLEPRSSSRSGGATGRRGGRERRSRRGGRLRRESGRRAFRSKQIGRQRQLRAQRARGSLDAGKAKIAKRHDAPDLSHAGEERGELMVRAL